MRHRVWSGGRLCGTQRDVAKLRQRGQDKGRWAQNGAQEAPQQTGQKRDREGSGALGLLRGEAVGAPLEGLKYGGLRDMVVPGGPSKRWGSLPTPGFV